PSSSQPPSRCEPPCARRERRSLVSCSHRSRQSGRETAVALSASMPKSVARGIDDVRALKDQVVGPSEWREVTQAMIDEFAELVGDHQWIHVDVERAKAESPFGTTVAHGNLTLSLIDGMRKDLSAWSGFRL